MVMLMLLSFFDVDVDDVDVDVDVDDDDVGVDGTTPNASPPKKANTDLCEMFHLSNHNLAIHKVSHLCWI